MTTSRTRVLLADDHTLVREGIRRLLEAEPGLEVVGEVADGDAALALLERVPVDVAVLDLSMPGRDGLAVLAEIRVRWPDVRVIVLTMHAGGEYVARAVREGAHAYLLKDSAVQDLVAAIETVRAGGELYSPAVQQRMAEALREGGKPGSALALLTDREREVLRLVAEGMPTKQIADVLNISGRTVESHRANLMRKLDVQSVARLTQIAIREGLIRGS